MRRKQAIVRLEGWCEDIRIKIIHLQRASKMYSFIKYILKTCVASCSVVLLMLGTFLTAEIIGAGENYELYLGLSISICVLQVILAVSNVIDGVMTPGKKSSNCSICAKSYSELFREMSCVIDDLKHPDDRNTDHYIPGLHSSIGYDRSDDSDPDDNTLAMYNYLVLLYSTKEQLILNIEPLVLFSMAKKNIIESYETNMEEF